MNSISAIHAENIARQRTQASATAARDYTRRHPQPDPVQRPPRRVRRRRSFWQPTAPRPA